MLLGFIEELLRELHRYWHTSQEIYSPNQFIDSLVTVTIDWYLASAKE